MVSEAPAERQRLDKWLWHARFGRTRSKSAEMVRSGYVRLNGVRSTDPGKGVKRGDVLTIALAGRAEAIRVVEFAERRGNPEQARTLYETLAE